MKCIKKARAFIDEHGLIRPRMRIMAAVSGGPDSMALLAILHELAVKLEMSLAAAYYDHGIRAASSRERVLVERLAARLGVPLILGAGNVPSESRRRKKGLEETARILRYRFLENAAVRWKADAVALGHTRDDQVETVLHHIIRGSGWRGLTGMPVKRGVFIRPLLSCSREELKMMLREHGLRYAIDESNRNNRLLRNRIRNRLIPYLKRHFNPAIDNSILRLRDNLAEGWESFERALDITIPERDCRGALSLSLREIAPLPDHRLYLLIDSVLRDRFGIVQDVDKTHYDSAKHLIRSGRSGSRVEFPHGAVLLKEQGRIRFMPAPGTDRTSQPGEKIILPGQGRFRLDRWGFTVQIKPVQPGRRNFSSSDHEAFIGSVTFPITVRSRRPGDRMIPFGLRGRKKLSDLFIDRKVPLSERDLIPVFADREGIFWVPGVATAERTRIGRLSRGTLHILLAKCEKTDENV